MNSRHGILVGTHLLALGLAYGVARSSATRETQSEELQASAKSSTRDRQESTGDGEALRAGFLQEQTDSSSKYEELKKSLPVADDPKAAALAAIAALGGPEWRDGLTAEEQANRFAEVEVRVLYWMKQSPEEAVEYLLANAPHLLNGLQGNVLPEIVTKNGVENSLPWLKKHPVFLQTLGNAALDELHDGGGIAFLKRFQLLFFGEHPELEADRRFYVGRANANPGNGMRGLESFFFLAGAEIPFRDRDALLELARQEQDVHVRMDLLSGFSQSSEQARQWLLEKIASGDLGDEVANQLRARLDAEAIRNPSIDFNERVLALKADEDFQGKSQQEAINELVNRDVAQLLEGGRDWRYEFRHGVAALDEIVAAVRGRLPNVPPEGEEALLVSLYRNLVEEDPRKALPLLDSLPEDRRREALFHSTWLSQVNISPDDYLSFFADLPEPETPAEKDLRTKGWNWKARGFLGRFGDDYVEWVKEMPEGLDKETAMNSLIWATREQNPAEARKLNEQLYPAKPNEEEIDRLSRSQLSRDDRGRPVAGVAIERSRKHGHPFARIRQAGGGTGVTAPSIAETLFRSSPCLAVARRRVCPGLEGRAHGEALHRRENQGAAGLAEKVGGDRSHRRDRSGAGRGMGPR